MTSYNVTWPDIYDAKTIIERRSFRAAFYTSGQCYLTGNRGFRVFLSYGSVRMPKWIDAYSEAKCGWI